MACFWVLPQLASSAEWKQTSSISISPSNYSQPGTIGNPVEISDNGCAVSVGCVTCNNNQEHGLIMMRSLGCGVTYEFWGQNKYGRQVITAHSDSGNLVVLGAYRASTNGTQAGEIRVFVGNPSNSAYSQRGQTIFGQAAKEEFGRALAADSHGARFVAAGKNVVRVFEYGLENQYAQIGQSIDTDSQVTDVKMTADGSLIAVGEGSVVAQYRWNGSIRSWERVPEDLVVDTGTQDFDMSRDGNVIVIGVPEGRGYMSVFRRGGQNQGWEQMGTSAQMTGLSRSELLQSWMDSTELSQQQDEGLGRSVSISADGTRVAGGSSWYVETKVDPNGNVSDQNLCRGGARVFQWNPNSSAWDVLGQGILQSCKRTKVLSDYVAGTEIYSYGYYGDRDGTDVDLDGSGSKLVVGNYTGYRAYCFSGDGNPTNGPCTPAGWATVYAIEGDSRPQVTVSASASNGGSIAPAGASQVAVGGSIQFELEAESGFIPSKVVGTCPGTLEGASFIAGPILESCEIEAVFGEPRTIDAVVLDDVGGAIIPEGIRTVAKDSVEEFALRSAPGFAIKSVAGTCEGSLIDDVFVAGPITQNCSILASFAEAHSVNASAGAGGSVYPEVWAVGDGGDKDFRITPDAGYWIDSISGSCAGVLDGLSYRVGPVTSDCDFNVSFRSARNVTVSASTRSGGSISPAGNQSVVEGGSLTFSVTPDDGYEIKELNIGSCPGSGSGNEFTAGPIGEDCTVQSNFSLKEYSVMTAVSGAGSLSPSESNVSHGGSTSFIAIPDDNKALSSFSGSCPGTASESLSGAIFEAGPITQDCLVEATFVDTFSIQPSAGSGGLVAPDSEVTLAEGKTFDFTLIPEEGFATAGVSGTCAGNLAGDTYSIGPITESCSFEAQFMRTVEITAGGHIEPRSATIFAGESKGFKVIYDAAKYEWTADTDCPGYVDGRWYRAINVTQDCYLKASISEIEVTVSAGAGMGGTVTPATLSIAKGTNASLSIASDIGFELASVTGSCPYGQYSGGRSGDYVIENLLEDCDLEVNFEPKAYEVSPQATEGGSISPSTVQQVDAGQQVSFTLASDSEQAELEFVGGTCRGSLTGDIFTTEPITEDCTVLANFLDFNTPPDWRPLGSPVTGGGHTVGVSGSGGVIAEGYWKSPSTERGRVGVHRWDGAEWLKMGSDITGGDNKIRQSQLSLSHDGQRIAVGAPLSARGGSNAGLAGVYAFDGSAWRKLGQDLLGDSAGAYFGSTVALSGDGSTLAVAAPNRSSNRGQVSIFRWSSEVGSWEPLGAPINGAATNSKFGTGLAISFDGSRFIASAPDKNSVFVYQWNSALGEWLQLGSTLQESDCGGGGRGVDISDTGDTIVYSSPCGSAGQARVYRLVNGEDWSMLGAPILGESSQGLASVKLDSAGGRVVTAGTSYSGNSGLVSVHDYNAASSTWEPAGSTLIGGSNDKFGYDIGISGGGNRLVVGQINNGMKASTYFFSPVSDPNAGGAVTLRAGPGGTASSEGEISVAWGDKLLVEAIPNSDHTLGEVTGSCPTRTQNNLVIVGPVYGDCEVQLAFQLVQHSVFPEATAGGSISPSSEQTVNKNGSVNFSLNPSEGFRIAPPGGSCNAVLSESTLTVGPVLSDCSVVANFEKSYALTATAIGAGGSIFPEGVQLLGEGESIAIEITTDPRSIFELDGDCPGDLQDNTFFVPPLTQDCELTVTFTELVNSIKPVAFGPKTVTPNSTVYVPENGFAFFEVVPDPGVAITGTNPIYTTCRNVERLSETTWRVGPYDWGEFYRHCEIEWSVTPTKTVTPVAGIGGKISPATPQQAIAGSSLLFTAISDEGYELASWSGCVGTADGNTYRVKVQNNCTVSADFEQLPGPLVSFAISPPSAGTVQSQSAQLLTNNSTSVVYQVSYGQRGSFSIVPTTGWVIDEIDDQSASCQGVIANGVYTTGELTADCEVALEFAQILTVTTSSEVGGTVNPEDEINVLPGAELTLSYSTEVGYQFDEVAGNCPGTLTPSTFELGPVYEDCTAIFRYSRTPSAPSEPQLLSWDAGDEQILFVVDDSEPDLYPAIYECSARCEDPSGAIFSASSGNRLIEVNGLENGVAYRCEIFVDNGVQKVGSSNIPLITPDGEQPEEKEPPRPEVISWEAGDGEILFVVAPASAEVYPPIYEWKAECYGPNDSLYPAASKVSDSRNILVSGLQNGTAYQCYVWVNNGVGEPPPATLPLITPDGSGPEESAPPVPVISRWAAEDGEIVLYFAAPATDIYPDIVEYSAECTDPQGTVFTGRSASPAVKVKGLINDVPYSCRVFWDNGIEKVGSAVVNGITPEELAMDGLPIWMLYIVTQPSEAESNPNP